MALIARNKDGTYATACALCGKPLAKPIFATSHFISDQSHDLYRFSDAAMHWECYVRWPDQSRFAAMYFDAISTMSRSGNWPQYWPVLWSSANVIVQYGLVVDEVSVVLRKSGTDIRVDRDKWQQWLGGGWREQCRPGLECEAVAELVPELSRLALPQKASPNGTRSRLAIRVPVAGRHRVTVGPNSIAMDALDRAIRDFTPTDGAWLPLEQLLEQAFASSDPKQYYRAIFNLFERFPEGDGAGVFWSALHGMEHVGGYEEMLVQHFRRFPSLMTQTMLRRILNSGQTHIGKMRITSLISA